MKAPILLMLATLGLSALSAVAAELEVEVGGVRSADGRMKLMLFDRAEGFRKEDKSRAVLALPAAAGTIRGMFSDLPPGRYAIVAYHDEDGDGKLKLSFGMFPTEGYGLSNNPSVSGPPAFKDAAFDVPDEGAKLAIQLAY
ncbi:MAG: DUF2141 domain-containing protein [Sulfurimicrobium sp.]|nr:DUF2141 domain-containing protein [Sulfurimicrobium sp.]